MLTLNRKGNSNFGVGNNAPKAVIKTMNNEQTNTNTDKCEVAQYVGANYDNDLTIADIGELTQHELEKKGIKLTYSIGTFLQVKDQTIESLCFTIHINKEDLLTAKDAESKAMMAIMLHGKTFKRFLKQRKIDSIDTYLKLSHEERIAVFDVDPSIKVRFKKLFISDKTVEQYVDVFNFVKSYNVGLLFMQNGRCVLVSERFPFDIVIHCDDL